MGHWSLALVSVDLVTFSFNFVFFIVRALVKSAREDALMKRRRRNLAVDRRFSLQQVNSRICTHVGSSLASWGRVSELFCRATRRGVAQA